MGYFCVYIKKLSIRSCKHIIVFYDIKLVIVLNSCIDKNFASRKINICFILVVCCTIFQQLSLSVLCHCRTVLIV